MSLHTSGSFGWPPDWRLRGWASGRQVPVVGTLELAQRRYHEVVAQNLVVADGERDAEAVPHDLAPRETGRAPRAQTQLPPIDAMLLSGTAGID